MTDGQAIDDGDDDDGMFKPSGRCDFEKSQRCRIPNEGREERALDDSKATRLGPMSSFMASHLASRRSSYFCSAGRRQGLRWTI